MTTTTETKVKKTKVSHTKKAMQTAERKARKRDEKILNGGVDVELLNDTVNAVVSHVASDMPEGFEIKVVNTKKKKPTYPFVQIFKQNKLYLRKNNYLTAAEIVFLDDLIPYMEFGTNTIVREDAGGTYPLTQTQIAEELGRTKADVSKKIKSLIDKGILARNESFKEEGKNARCYMIMVNPNYAFVGDKMHIEKTLQRIFSVANAKSEVLKDMPVRLV